MSDYKLLAKVNYNNLEIGHMENYKLEGRICIDSIKDLGSITTKTKVNNRDVFNHKEGTVIVTGGVYSSEGFVPSASYYLKNGDIASIYNLLSFEKMHVYSPALTDEEIKAECEKSVYIPVSNFNIPDWKGR